MRDWLLLVAAFLFCPGCTSQNACEEPEDIDFGEIVSTEKAKYLENDRVQYKCNLGYVLEGPEWIQCKGQKWTPPPPKCLERGRNCSGPPRIENGDIITLSEKQYRSGSSVEFRCQNHYAMEGQNRSFCDNGAWTNVPICLDPCVIPRTELESQKVEIKDVTDVPENIFVQRGLSIELTCRTGYVPAENSSQSAFAIHCDGTPPAIPKCKEITCNSPGISNGSFRPQRTVYHDEDLIRIRCNSGFTFEPGNGEQVVECTKNGWSPSPKCVKKSCGPAPEIPNASLEQENRQQYDSGKIINYTCNRGFDTEESTKITCRRGEWEGSFTCKDVRCSSPPNIQNAQIIGETKAKYLPREKVHIRCNAGYGLLGSPFITCLKNVWTQIPRCTGLQGRCGRPPSVENGDIMDTPKLTYLNSESVIYHCQNFYIMEGSSRVSCQNGDWSPTPTCRVACTVSPEDMRQHNIRLKWTNEMDKIFSTDGNVVQFECLRGYKPYPHTRSFRVFCVDGKFDYPFCIPA